ncbi:hypothetical protein Sjap_009526 [Stephania japonica]|uniref:Leucine-rich repeat-containing N-terminal plant-type domain-containing protein n=1 Tax=Stephania japonica TaxID=461633 RepID=A0AAP0JTZ7_9MAGN
MSPRYALFLALVSLSFFAYRNVSAARCHPDDKAGLLAFKSDITEDPSGMLSDWKADTDCCQWKALFCGLTNRVQSIRLGGQPDNPKRYLSGTFSPLLSNLVQLDQIILSNNRFSGPIPDSLRRLNELYDLDLSGNRFSGEIPNFWDSFPKLLYLRLSNNEFIGGIPTSIASLAPKLMYLELGNNRLSGKIPEFISNFKALDTLDLSSNLFSGVLPKSFKNLTKIFNLNLARNNLVDPFPDLAVKGIESLDLSYNKFKLGKIPKWVTSSTIIYSLKLAGCGIKMRLDDWKPMRTYYYDFIDLSDNEITGSAIKLVNSTEELAGFWASGNQLKFNLSDLKMPESLKYLDLSRNQVFGSVPHSIVGLEKLNLSYNSLCGKIPTSKFPAEAFAGNACLCGSPLPACRIQ